MLRVSIVIPTYNESKNLPLLTEEIFHIVDRTRFDLELIIVDDNSPDGTGAVADELAKKYPIQVIHRSGKLGLGSAVREGFAKSTREVIGVMDADLSHDPSILNDMLAELATGGSDIAMGSRFEKGSTVEQWKWWRRIISQIGVGITHLITGVKDPLSGFFFFKRDVVKDVKLETVGYKILLEILVKGKYSRVKEFAYRFRIRKFSTSKLDAKEYWLFLKQIITYAAFAITKKHNKYLLAVLLLAAGLLCYRIGARTFWMDETMVLSFLKHSLGGFISDYIHKPDNHPPLYYFLVLIVSKLLPWTELTIRLTSMVAGLAMVWLVYKFTYRVTKTPKTALLAAFFTALSSYFVLISQMARYHSLAGFFALLTLYYFYQLYIEGYSKRAWVGYLVALALTGYTDYPHFIYMALVTNALWLYRVIRRTSFAAVKRWILGQVLVGIVCSPMVWMVYHRVIVQGDGGWDNVNLLANSWFHIVAGILFHIYTFFFGENILPWNYIPFGIGCAVLLAALTGLIRALVKKTWSRGEKLIVGLGFVLIFVNTLFMNVADPRYNFIVYPKFGFVTFPLVMMSLVFCISVFTSKKMQTILFVAWGIVGLIGLYNFYNLRNYLNGSYFNTFSALEYVRDNSKPGDLLAITPDAGEGVYDFYRQKYFANHKPLFWSEIPNAPKNARVWFFATGSDATDTSVSTDAVIPAGYKVVSRFDSVPLDETLKKVKEKILHRPSYTFKYSVFLLEKL